MSPQAAPAAMKTFRPLLNLLLVSYCTLLGCDHVKSGSTAKQVPDSPPVESPPEPEPIRIDTPPPPPVLRSEPQPTPQPTPQPQPQPQPQPTPQPTPTPTPTPTPKSRPTRGSLEAAGVVFGQDSKVDLSNCQNVNSVLEQLPAVVRPKRIIFAGENTNEVTFQAVAQLRSVERLDLPNVQLPADSAAHLASMQRLSFLNLPKATLPLEAVKQIARSRSIAQFRCAESTINDESLEHLAKLPNLTAVDLSDCPSVSDKGVSYLSACPRLKFLKLAGEPVDDNTLKAIRNIKSMRILGLNATTISDAGIEQLAGLNLSGIQLVRSPIGDTSVKVLSGMSNLTVANLRGTNISDEALRHLTACSRLKKIEVSECDQPGITDLGCEELAKIQSLESVNLWLSKITDAGLEPLASLPKLTSLNLDNTAITDEGTKVIAKMKRLTWLHLGKTKITDACVPTLKSMTKLTFLDITNTALSGEASQEIADALEPSGCEVKR